VIGLQAQRSPVEVVAPNVTKLSLEGPLFLQKSGLHFPHLMSYQKWESIGRQLLALADSSTWWIADWLVYGETSFQDRYAEAIRSTSLNYQTLRNYAWVARRFHPSRRRDALSFGHHAEVAALQGSEQDYWLRKAEELGWSRNQLRREVRASLVERQITADARPDHSPADDHHSLADASARAISLRVTTDQLEQFRAAAQRHNLSLDEWAIQALKTAVIDQPHLPR